MKYYSDRGKISELGKKHEEEIPLTSWEKRLTKLINYAMTYRDSKLMASLGFIYEPFASKAELPVAIVRLREKVQKINQSSTFLRLKSELERCFEKYGTMDNTIIHEYYKKAMKKIASKPLLTGAHRVKRIK